MKIGSFICKVQIEDHYGIAHDAVEYEEESTDNGRTKTCFIASEDGKPFQFFLHFGHDVKDKDFNSYIFADGEMCDRLVSRASESRQSYFLRHSCLKTSSSNGMFEKRKYRFGKLETVDTMEPNIEDRKEILKEVGSLKVVVWECKLLRGVPAPAYKAPNLLKSIEKKPIFEKSLKGKSVPHRTSLGEASYQSLTTYQTEIIQPSVATFIFRYTSEESLKNQRIIPATPEPEDDDIDAKEDNNSDPGEMTIDQMRQELRRRREAEAAIEGDRRRKIKREPLIPPGPVETIDLTDDS